MKSVLIVGEGSFVGSSVQDYLTKWPDKYTVSVIGTLNEEWKKISFASFDTVFHVAGIAHSDVGKATDEIRDKYYLINTKLAIDVAKKAKEECVKQFIFMSSAIVYGDSAPIGHQKLINTDTPCSPSNFYGDSKLQAENGLLPLQSDFFKIAILRCPMIYGKGSKGNFPVLEKLAKRLPFFPKVDNKRSMLYIGNLQEFVRLIIENEEYGLFWPCNKEWSNTSEMVKMIAECHGKKIWLVPGFGWILRFFSVFSGSINKAFGNLAYEADLGDYKTNYRLYSLKESIEATEL